MGVFNNTPFLISIWLWDAHDGDQYLELDTGNDTGGNVYAWQPISLVPGYSYNLEFYAYRWWDGDNTLAIRADDQVIGDIITDDSLPYRTWTQFIYALPVGTKKVGFEHGGTPDDRFYSIDAVSVTPTSPEVFYKVEYTYDPSEGCTMCESSLCVPCNPGQESLTSSPINECFAGVSNGVVEPSICWPSTSS